MLFSFANAQIIQISHQKKRIRILLTVLMHIIVMFVIIKNNLLSLLLIYVVKQSISVIHYIFWIFTKEFSVGGCGNDNFSFFLHFGTGSEWRTAAKDWFVRNALDWICWGLLQAHWTEFGLPNVSGKGIAFKWDASAQAVCHYCHS